MTVTVNFTFKKKLLMIKIYNCFSIKRNIEYSMFCISELKKLLCVTYQSIITLIILNVIYKYTIYCNKKNHIENDSKSKCCQMFFYLKSQYTLYTEIFHFNA